MFLGSDAFLRPGSAVESEGCHMHHALPRQPADVLLSDLPSNTGLPVGCGIHAESRPSAQAVCAARVGRLQPSQHTLVSL